MIISMLIHIAKNGIISFFSIGIISLYVCHIFTHSSIYEKLGYFQALAIVNIVANKHWGACIFFS